MTFISTLLRVDREEDDVVLVCAGAGRPCNTDLRVAGRFVRAGRVGRAGAGDVYVPRRQDASDDTLARDQRLVRVNEGWPPGLEPEVPADGDVDRRGADDAPGDRGRRDDDRRVRVALEADERCARRESVLDLVRLVQRELRVRAGDRGLVRLH